MTWVVTLLLVGALAGWVLGPLAKAPARDRPDTDAGSEADDTGE